MVRSDWSELLSLGLRVCLGCHVGPSILVLACDWSVFRALDLKVCFPSISAQIPA
jgi:hypothetical protein